MNRLRHQPDRLVPKCGRLPGVRTLVAALLLLLAASPLTAPFSVHTPIDLLGDIENWAPPKKLADDIKTDVRPPSAISVPGMDWVGAPPVVLLAFVPGRRQYSPPLRL